MQNETLDWNPGAAGIYGREGMFRIRSEGDLEVAEKGLSPSEREKAHAEIEKQIADFLASGGAIEKVDSGTCALSECGATKGRSSVLKALKRREMAARKS